MGAYSGFCMQGPNLCEFCKMSPVHRFQLHSDAYNYRVCEPKNRTSQIFLRLLRCVGCAEVFLKPPWNWICCYFPYSSLKDMSLYAAVFLVYPLILLSYTYVLTKVPVCYMFSIIWVRPWYYSIINLNGASKNQNPLHTTTQECYKNILYSCLH